MLMYSLFLLFSEGALTGLDTLAVGVSFLQGSAFVLLLLCNYSNTEW